jgi:hypothetical protein
VARNFLTPVNLNKLELQNARIQNLSTDPSEPVSGQIYYNSVDSQLKYYNGGASAWQVIGQSVEQLEDAVADLLAAGNGISLDYNDETDTLTIANTGVLSVAGTENEVTVSASAGAVTIGLPDTITADLTGTASSATFAVTAGTANAVAADSVALGTDTTGDYVASASSGTGISVSGSGGEGSSLTITNTGVTSVTGTANEVTVSASAGEVVLGLPDNVTIGGTLTVTGDLVVSGSATTLNTETLLVEDNIVVLNNNVTGTPTLDAGIEVERGDEANASFLWDESEGRWTASNGSASYVTALKYSENVGDDVATSFVITHGLNSRDAVVNVYDNATYETVEVDVARTDANTVTVSFGIVPGNNAYRVVIVA